MTDHHFTMLVTPQSNRHDFNVSLGLAIAVAIVGIAIAFASPWWLLISLSAPLVFWGSRRKTKRRLAVMNEPFPDAWEQTLLADVAYFVALDTDQRDRFRKLMQVFVDEVAITGIRTDADQRTVALVAASAVIPIFGFDDWEYSGLGEVLIYPNAFSEGYQTDAGSDRRTLGMVGDYHLSGVMILSKPDLIAGFTNQTDKRNVGIHEFSHLVDKQDGSIDGVIATGSGHTSADVSVPWIRWVGEELRRKPGHDEHIDDYAYTNEAEYLAVLSEYFFDTPAMLEKKDPRLYKMLEKIYRQDPKKLLANVSQQIGQRKHRIGRNDDCPCGSGEKFKKCCLKRRHRRPGRRQTSSSTTSSGDQPTESRPRN
ncbi:MAG: zinc-dependent peptidase [Rubripirellula sp.]